MSTDCSNNTSALTLSPCGSITIFDLGIELTENPMSKCVSLCRPTWVQGVIPVTGALFSRWSTTNRFSCFLHTLDYLNRFCLTTVFPKFHAAGPTELRLNFHAAGLTVIYMCRTHTEGNGTRHLCVGAVPSVSPVLVLATRAVED